jgi:hypothetical protein
MPRVRRRRTGPVGTVVSIVFVRDGGRCVRCGVSVNGERGISWSLHHRRPRRAGGDRRPEANSPANLVVLCGSGTTGCHGWVESNRAEALSAGWLLHGHEEPTEMPVRTWYGRVLLSDEGRWVACR